MTPRPTRRFISTFTKAAAFCLLAAVLAGAKTAQPPSLEDLLANAALALGQRDPAAADFWMARYLGRSGPLDGLQIVLGKRKLDPAAFLSDSYDPEFLDWFEKSTHRLWGVGQERVREGLRSMEITQAVSADRFVTVVGAPELQSWFLWSPSDSEKSRRLLLALVSGPAKIYLYSGKRLNKTMPVYFKPFELDTKKHAVQHVWKPEFHDLDADGTDEVWLRYNLVRGNGFSQVLDVYSLGEDKGLALVRRFRGEFEGVARRLESGEVEEATGFASTSDLAHMEFDKHRIDTWRYDKGKFRKYSRRVVDHLLKNPEWKKYYFNDEMEINN